MAPVVTEKGTRKALCTSARKSPAGLPSALQLVQSSAAETVGVDVLLHWAPRSCLLGCCRPRLPLSPKAGPPRSLQSQCGGWGARGGRGSPGPKPRADSRSWERKPAGEAPLAFHLSAVGLPSSPASGVGPLGPWAAPGLPTHHGRQEVA